MDERQRLLGQLPSVDGLLTRADVQALVQRFGRGLVTEGARRAVAGQREALLAGRTERAELDAEDITAAIVAWTRPSLRKVVNATGIMLHTNLGRAPLPRAAIEHTLAACSAYSNLEMDLATGRRGSRMDLVRDILIERTGAEAALVVNNNAAAVYLALRALTAGREVIVSRGELVEIGGSFRIPDVMAASGAVLREVGTTNRTRLADYERAVGPETAMILKVHRSNFELLGFTEQASLEQLVELARRHRIVLMMDLGSATLLERPPAAVRTYSATAALAKGPDLVCFSGDKLLGGPQAGIVLGAQRLIERLANDPMARALRVDKMTLAALEACLNAYRGGDEGAREIPLVGMLLASADELERRAERLLASIRHSTSGVEAEVISTQAQVGGGSLPLVDFPSFGVALRPFERSVADLAARLRTGDPAVLGRLQHNRLVLDVRTLLDDGQLSELATAVAQAASPADG